MRDIDHPPRPPNVFATPTGLREKSETAISMRREEEDVATIMCPCRTM